MKKVYSSKIQLLLMGLAFLAMGLTSCKDDIPEDSLYTYKAEMLSDFLRNNENFSQFARMVEKAGKMDLFSAYGTYTCFAPTNDAVNSYLARQGLSSVEELSNEECDTLVCTMTIATDVLSLSDMEGITFMEENNMLGRALKLQEVPMTIDTKYGKQAVSTFIVNGSGEVIYELANDSVENGIVHPVNGVVRASSDLLPDVIRRDSKLSIFAEALVLTGLHDQMVRREDPSYNYRDYEEREALYHSDNHNNWCWVPRTRRYGYTAFCVPDEVLNHYSEFDDVNYNKNIYTWEDLYDYACTVYPEGAGQSYYAKNATALRDERNPLHKLIAYHLLNRRGVYEKLYTNCTILRTLINPTEWYSTMNPHSTMKVECVYSRNKFHKDDEQTLLDGVDGVVYLNHMYDPDRPGLYERGAMVYKNVSDEMANDQNCENGIYYYIDRLIDYGQDTRDHVFNARMRLDMYTLWPELMNNDIRTTQTNLLNDSPESKTTNCKNYIFPANYLDNVVSSADGDFIYQGARNYYWSYEGDEFNLRSDQGLYDLEFELPSVPSGQYQIRLGFALIPSRGIGQFYVDGKPQGIPLDMRSTGWVAKTGWQQLYTDDASAKYSASAEQNKKDLHNQGWYHGPASVRCINVNNANPFKDDDLSLNNSHPFCNIANTIRRVIYTGSLNGDVTHKIRIRSVWSEGGAELMFDYIEIVPKSVYGIDSEGAGEDDL